MPETKEKFDLVGFCMDWETSSMEENDEVKGFQYLVDSGIAWQLQGCYGRRAAELIREGKVKGGVPPLPC